MAISDLPYRGRLAPSPTGFLHCGHARTFALAQERARGGSLILRIEDLDRERCQAPFAEAIFEDLRWLGLAWQEGPDVGGKAGPYRQSERPAYYQAAWRKLVELGAIYPCRCTRREVQRALTAPHPEGENEPLYPGTCRPPPRSGARAAVPGENWRFRVPDGETISFWDGAEGVQNLVAGRDFGDFVVWRKDGLPAYQLAVVVDDAAMGVTEVVRGADLLLSTAQQILLYCALGWPVPRFFHCPLLADASGRRLAKRHGAHTLRALREAGGDGEALRRALLADYPRESAPQETAEVAL